MSKLNGSGAFTFQTPLGEAVYLCMKENRQLKKIRGAVESVPRELKEQESGWGGHSKAGAFFNLGHLNCDAHSSQGQGAKLIMGSC